MTPLLWEDGTPRSVNNAFTRSTNSINWTELTPHSGAVKGGAAASKLNGTPVYLPNSSQQKAYSSAGQPSHNLSKRELQVLRQYDKGDSYAEIASTLSLSLKTIECHASGAIKKLGARNCRHACAMLREDHLL
jgi:DNA-binding NarL/FixJ family response regulator